MDAGLISDFWWLGQSQTDRYTYLELGHSKPVDDYTTPIIDAKVHHISDMDKFRSSFQNTNVYRSLKISDASLNGDEILGPFLVDIDNEEEDLDDAQGVTKQVVEYLRTQLMLSLDDLRIFFSGHKGFNIEVRPQALEIAGSVPDQIRLSSKKLDDVIAFLCSDNKVQDQTKNIVSIQGTGIDRIYGDRFGYKLKHPYIRLHNSINKWIRSDGSEVAGMKIERTIQQLWNMSAAEISLESRKLAQIP